MSLSDHALVELYSKACNNPLPQLVRLKNGNVVIGLVMSKQDGKPMIFTHNRFYHIFLLGLRLGGEKEEIIGKIDNLLKTISSQEPLNPDEYILNDPPEWSD